MNTLLFHFVSFKLTSLLQRKRKARKRLSLLSSPQILLSLFLKVGIKPSGEINAANYSATTLSWGFRPHFVPNILLESPHPAHLNPKKEGELAGASQEVGTSA